MTGDFKLKNIKFVFLAIAKIKNWPIYFLDLFNLTQKKKITYELRDGTKFCVRAKTTDRGIVTSVALLDEYRVKDTDLPKDSTVIDIGGQTGIFTVFVSKKVSKVYSYEPTAENYSMLKKNILINKLQNNIFAFKKAVSSREKTFKIYMSSNNTGGHSAFRTGEADRYETVKATTLKNIFEENSIKRCDLMKIDAEGSEYDILYPLPKKYFSRILKIYMEYHDLDNKKKNHKFLVRFLKRVGYNVEYHDGLLYASRTSL